MIRRFLGHITIKVFLVILIFIIPINLLIYFMNREMIDNMEEKVFQSVESVVEHQTTILENRISNTDYLLYNMINQNLYGNLMLNAENDADYNYYKVLLYKQMTNTFSFFDGPDVCFLGVKEWDDLLIWDMQDIGFQKIKKCIKSEYENLGWENGWHLKTIDGKDWLCFFIELKDCYYGGWIDLAEANRILEQDILLKDKEFSISEIIGEDRPGYQRISSVAENGSFYINIYLAEEGFINQTGTGRQYMYIGILLMLLGLPAVYLLMRHWLITPLKVLNNAYKKLEKGNLEYRISEKSSSIEYENSYKAFNEMSEQIQTLKIENYEKKLTQNQMEMDNLRLQIQPHFLLNTFSLIYSLAKKKENGTIGEIVVYLTTYFRYLLRSESGLEAFEKEQELIERYIRVAKVRYPGCVEIVYDYDTEIKDILIPPLLIHNFVENVIKHVVTKGVVTHISIEGKYEDQVVTFMIKDDGQGMSEEKIQELYLFMRGQDPERRHLGYLNSYRRLKYFYGDKANIVITSEEGNGTCITLIMPYEKIFLGGGSKET